MSRPRLLFLCHLVPYPPDGGAEIRAFNLLRLLAGAFDVTLLCLRRRGDSAEATGARVSGLNAILGVTARAVSRRSGRLSLLAAHARSVLSGRAYTIYTLESSEFRAALNELLAGPAFDVIHVDTLDLSAYLPLLPLGHVVCGHHNVESDLLRRRSVSERSRLRRLYIRHQARLVEREEQDWCRAVALNAVVSERDAQTLGRLVPGSRITVLPNGVDTSVFLAGPPGDTGLLFVGGTGWFPNRDALKYFAGEILPLIRSQSQVTVRWVGHNDRAARTVAERAGIMMEGYVQDIRPFIRESACFVVPLRIGGGTRLKILDAWALGSAIVSTSIGCEGLAAVDGVNMLIRDEPQAFAEAVMCVLRDRALRQSLARQGRATAESVYGWQAIGNSMIRVYRRVSEGELP